MKNTSYSGLEQERAEAEADILFNDLRELGYHFDTAWKLSEHYLLKLRQGVLKPMKRRNFK